MKLTKRSIDALTWNGRTTHIEYDDDLTGFGVRLYKSGQKSFIVSAHPRGTSKRRIVVLAKVGELTVNQARDEAIQHLAAAARGLDLVAERNRAHQESEDTLTFRDVADHYLHRVSQPGGKRSWKSEQQMLKKDVFPILGAKHAEAVTRKDINQVLDQILARGAGVVANRTLAAMRSVLSHGVDQGWIPTNPCWRMKAPSKETPRSRYLSEEEIVHFWEATSELHHVTAMGFRLMLLAGQRAVRETLGMRWDEIDIEDPKDAWWHLPAERTKSGRSNLVPLSELAVSCLIEVRSQGHDPTFVFPSRIGHQAIANASKPRLQMCELSGFHFQFKDLRRTVATHLHRHGVSRFVVARILNHADKTVTGRHYDVYEYAAEKKEALDAWGDHVSALVDGSVSPSAFLRPIAA